MPTHFSDIGFQMQGPDELVRLATLAVKSGEHRLAPHGEYIVWSPGDGIEVWVQILNAINVVDINPHFSGSGRMTVGVTEMLPDPENPLQGGITGWAGATVGVPGTGAYPLTAHLPDFDLHRLTLLQPAVVTLQIAAFAQEAVVYPHDQAYFAAQRGEFKLAAESFFPLNGALNLLAAPDPLAGVPVERALMCGHLERVELRKNPVTGQHFYYLTTRVLDGLFDVVADQQFFPQPPRPGGVLQGTFWFSARLP
jgi:hypothetical protein